MPFSGGVALGPSVPVQAGCQNKAFKGRDGGTLRCRRRVLQCHLGHPSPCLDPSCLSVASLRCLEVLRLCVRTTARPMGKGDWKGDPSKGKGFGKGGAWGHEEWGQADWGSGSAGAWGFGAGACGGACGPGASGCGGGGCGYGGGGCGPGCAAGCSGCGISEGDWAADWTGGGQADWVGCGSEWG